MKQWIRFLCLSLLLIATGNASAQNVAKIGDTEYETLQGAFNAATNGQTVTLLKDYIASNEAMACGTRQFVINKSITFDGGGFTLTTKQNGIGIGNVTSNVDQTYAIENNINVTIKNITILNQSKGARCIDTRGKIGSLTLDGVTLNTQGASGTTQPLTIGGDQAETATVSISNSTIQTNDAGTAYYAITTFNPVDMTISNSTIKGWACIYAKGQNSSAGSDGSTINIDGSALVSSNDYSGSSNAFSAFMMEDNNVNINVTNSKITINNTGDQKQTVVGYNYNSRTGLVTLGDGNTVTFAGPNDCELLLNGSNANISLIGGTYNFDPSEYLAEGYKAVKENGTWTVKEIVYVAQIGVTKYESLAEAVAAANTGDVIEIIKADDYKLPNLPNNVTIEGKADGVVFKDIVANPTNENNIASIPSGATFKNVAFEVGNIDYHGFTHAGIINMEGCTLNGRLTSYADMNFTNCEFVHSGDYNMWVYGQGNVLYDGCTFTNNTKGKMLHLYCEDANQTHKVNVKNCKFVNKGELSKSAINVKATSGSNALQYELHLEGNNTYEGSFPTAVGEQDNSDHTWILSPLAQVDDRKVNPDNIKVYENNKLIYPVNYVAKIGNVKYETLEAAFAAAQDGETVTLLADCTGNGIKAPQGKFTTGLTVDFAGFTYTVDGATVGSAGTETNGFQLLKENKITFKNGTITSEKAKILIQNYSDLTLEGMTLTLNKADYTEAYTLSNNNGNVVIDGTTINANPAGGFAFDVCRYASYPSVSVTVKGKSVINGNVEVYASNNDAKDGFKLMLEAGTLNGEIVLDATAKAAMAATPEKAQVMKSETFTTDAPADYKWVAAEEGKQKLVAKEYVAQIGNNKYETLEAAFAAAQDGETVTLLADCTGNGIKAPQGKFTTGLTVDFAGFTYTVDGATVGSAGTETNGFQLLKENKITFKNGTITSEKAKILIQNYSDLTLEGMTLTLNNANYTSAYTLSDNSGNVVVDETTINANPAGGFAFDVCRYADYPSVSVTVKGESVINGDIEVSASKSDAKDGFKLMLEAGTMTGNIVLDASAKAAMAATPEKATVSKSNTLTAIAAPDGYKWVDNGDGTSTLAPAHYIAAIGDEKYETLQEAINACEAGAETTIKLLVDVEDGSAFEIADSKKNANLNIIIDFDNHSYNVTKNAVGSARTKSQAMHFASGNTLTLKNGTISSAATSEENNLKMMMQNYCDLTLDGMTIDCSNINGGTYPDYSGTTYEYWSLKSVPVFNFNTGNATIKNTTISFRDGDNVGLCVDGGTVALGEGVVVNGAVSAVSGSVTITDGKYSGAVTADQATLKISGGVYTKVPADEYCADGFVVTDNTDEATKDQYLYTVKTKEEAGIFELIDGEPYKYVDGVAKAEKVTYKRTFKNSAGHYQCWFVPFDYTIDENTPEGVEFFKINQFSASNSESGTSTAADEKAVWMHILKVDNGTLKANRPYLVKVPTAGEYEFTTENVELKAKQETCILPLNSSYYNFDFYGTYVKASLPYEKDLWLSMNTGGNLFWNDANQALTSYRWYILTSTRNIDYAKPNIFIVEGDDDTDGINNAQAAEGEIQGIYTLGGMKVEHPVKGVNIIKYTDGRTKKIYVK